MAKEREEMLPIAEKGRHLSANSYTIMLLSMTITTSVFFLGWISSVLGLSLAQTIVAAIVGNATVALVMYLNGYPGTKHGIPFPIQLRYTYGYKGATVPLIIRMIISLFWYGVDGYIAAWAITEMILVLGGVSAEATISTAHTYAPYIFVAYLAFVCGIGSIKKIRGIKYLDLIAGPLLLVFFTIYTVYLLFFAPTTVKTLPLGVGWMSSSFFLAIAVQTAWWATIATNISDISRFNKHPENPNKTLVLPHILGLILPQVFGTALGWFAVSLTGTMYSPIDVIVYYAPMPIIALLGLVFAALATASTNLTGDIPAVGNGIIQFFKVSWRKSVVIATVIAFFVGPWWAFKESLDVAIYLTEFTSAYGCWLGPIASVMVADYWIGKKRGIEVKELYNPKGIYHGFSMIGLASMAIGILGEYVIGFMTNSLKWYIIPFPGVELSWYYGSVISFLAYFVWMQFGHKR